jgi:lysophospholipase L1-like esterase
MAFGDSITAGEIPTFCSGGAPPVRRTSCTSIRPLPTLSELFVDAMMLRQDAVNSAAAYPTQLAGLLASRYTAQTVAIDNEGLPGEQVDDALDRFRAALTRLRPEVVLLQEGINDIHRRQSAATPYIQAALRSMIREANGRGIRVFLGTLLPEDPCGCRAFDYNDGVDDIATANGVIRALAAAENATLVDLYPAFAGQVGTLLTFDGLHPNEAGYAKMADQFFEVIKTRLEVP